MTGQRKCARDSDWCDGVICRDNGIACPNAEPTIRELHDDIKHAAYEAKVRQMLRSDSRSVSD